MSWYGDFALGSTVRMKFTTVDSSGAAVALASTAIIDWYVDDSTTPSTAGVTLTVDFNTVVGLNHVRVIAASTSGFATASEYQVHARTGVAGGKSIAGYVIGGFSIENRSHLRPTVAGRTLDVSAGGEAGLDWANIGSPTTAQNLSATNIDVDQVVASVSGNVGGSVASIATGGIAATSFAAGAIDAAAVAANAIGASEIAAAALTAAKFAAAAIDSTVLSTNVITMIHDDPIGDSTVTFRQAARVMLASLAGKLSGAATTSVVIRNVADTKNVITAAVDANGNRSTIVLDLS